jgi:hypothetical protein
MFTEGLYRLVGALAPMNQRLSQSRVNLIPANNLLMIGLAAPAGVNWNTAARVVRSRRAPEPQSVRSVLLSPVLPQRTYVALEGTLMSDAGVDLPKGSSGNLATDYTWAPLVDRSTHKAILVQFPAGRVFAATESDATLQGVLRRLPRAVSDQVQNGRRAGYTIDSRFMLVEGGRPGSLGFPVVAGSVFTAVVLMLLWATVSRNVIFLPDDSAPSGVVSPATPAAPLRVSARFTKDSRTTQFFTNMPAIATRMANGDMALASHIERSSTYMGLKTSHDLAMWVVAIRAGTMTDVQRGHVFWGLQKTPAIRFRYASSINGKPERAVVGGPAGDPLAAVQGC